MAEGHKLYGAEFSLYSGKVRSYFRKKGIPFDEITPSLRVYRKFIIPRTGVSYIPVVQTPNDEVLQDTTVIIDELESRYPKHSVYPDSPKQKLVSLLLEVYGDEWLVIPAMHYRWYYLKKNSPFIYGEFGRMAFPWAPKFLQQWFGKKLGSRFKNSVSLLGVTEDNYQAVEASYEKLLLDLQAHFEQHDFLLGGRPTIADFGFIGPLYAHLYRDPAPRKLMRGIAPDVVKWVKRMISDKPSLQFGELLADDAIPQTLLPILKRMSAEQLPVLLDTDQQLSQWRLDNPDEATIKRIIGKHKFKVEGVEGERRIAPYCLWMFQRPIDFYQSMGAEQQVICDELLTQTGFNNALRQGLQNRLARPNNKLQFA